MTRYMPMLAIVAAGAAGCTPTYRVHVNTFADLAEPVSKTAPIYVATDPNSRNPILNRQIESKIKDLLQGYGYNPVDRAEAARYLLTFRAGVDSERVLDYAPIYRPYYGFYGWYGGPWHYGYTTYVPYIETVYAHWLEMKLYAQDHTAGARGEPVWIGEAVVGRNDPELRKAVNYLLVGCIEYLGVDTEGWVTVKIKRDDPRLLGLVKEP
jgi:hypothetical protein